MKLKFDDQIELLRKYDDSNVDCDIEEILDNLRKTISSKREFVLYFECLILNYGIVEFNIENRNTYRYLESMQALVESKNNDFDDENLSWRQFADVLYFSLFYE